MSDHDMYTNVFMYDHDRTSSRSPAFAPSDTSLSTVFAIFFSVAICKAVFLLVSCVEACTCTCQYEYPLISRTLLPPLTHILRPPEYLPAPRTPLTLPNACSVTCASRAPASFVTSISSAAMTSSLLMHARMRGVLPSCTSTHMHASLSEVYQVGGQVGAVFDITCLA